MMVLRLVDIGNYQFKIQLHCGREIISCPEPISYFNPLSYEDREILRWYLEEYLEFPYGAMNWKAQQVEKKMYLWGKSLFEQIFTTADFTPDPLTLYKTGIEQGYGQCQICVISNAPDVMSIPWELMYDSQRGFLSLLLEGFYRQHIVEEPVEEIWELRANEPFRVLLVIARPYEKERTSSTVARLVYEVLRQFRSRIHVEILRPPTFNELKNKLNENPGYYHLVHFDGHGTFEWSERGDNMTSKLSGVGYLIFETEEGKEDKVSAQELAHGLAKSKISLFVLNACESGKEDLFSPFASVASQLISKGAKGVISMSYVVYQKAAKIFMEQFYQSLVNNSSIGKAVTKARMVLDKEAKRDSVTGQKSLKDWIVPTLYLQDSEFVPIPLKKNKELSEEIPNTVTEKMNVAKEISQAGRFGFIGRDRYILELEMAMRKKELPCTILTGVGGVGKTELAKGFARWYAETGGCPGGVYYTSFRYRADFVRVIGSVFGYGTDFSRYSEDDKWRILIEYLRENPCLLIWDNFETVAGYPRGKEPLASADEQRKLSEFLKALVGGKSRVIITTRTTDESWLGIIYQNIEVLGLEYNESIQIAEMILRTIGKTLEDFKNDENMDRLIKMFNGHPQSLEVTIPLLKKEQPLQVIDALHNQTSNSIKDVSLSYAFAHLNQKIQKHLPIISLFVSPVSATSITLFVGPTGSHKRLYKELMGEILSEEEWRCILNEVSVNGLIKNEAKCYELHPTLSIFLQSRLQAMLSNTELTKLKEGYAHVYGLLAQEIYDVVANGRMEGIALMMMEEANMLKALSVAERVKSWDVFRAIMQTVDKFYEVTGRFDELRILNSKYMAIFNDKAPKDLSLLEAELWLYLIINETNSFIEENKLKESLENCNRVKEFIELGNEGKFPKALAVSYYQLGMIAEEKNDLETAESWYKKSLDINESMGSKEYMATDYFQLGKVLEAKKCYQTAQEWYYKALKIFEDLSLSRSKARVYHQLGIISQKTDNFDEAERWYFKALKLFLSLDLAQDVAPLYHQLGRIAQEKRNLASAEDWYQRSLKIKEKLGLDRDSGSDYHQLGMIAVERGQLDEAEQWYLQALDICRRLGPERDIVSECYQLGIVALKKRELDKAESWNLKALEFAERLMLEEQKAMIYHQLGIVAHEIENYTKALDWYQMAVAIFKELCQERNIVWVYQSIGLTTEAKGCEKEAEVFYQKALDILEKIYPSVPARVTTLKGFYHGRGKNEAE